MKKENRKVGRPKLADKKLKKNSIIMSIVCIILVFMLIIGGVFAFNIHPKVKKIKGEAIQYKTYEIGDKICLGDECFYVIEDNGDTVDAMSKDNLIKNGETYRQARTEIGESNHYYIDPIRYWCYTNTTQLKEEYGTEFPVEVFSSDSLAATSVTSSVSYHLLNYEKYLKNLGYSSVKVGLVSLNQIKALGCTEESCDAAPAFTTYITSIQANLLSTVDECSSYYMFTYDGYFKNADRTVYLRPRITIHKSELPGSTDIDNSKYKYGEEVCIGSECFNVLSKTDSKLTLLSKYNIEPSINRQSKNAGIYSFSDTAYWADNADYGDTYPKYVFDENSNFATPVSDYESYLKSLGYSSISARLFSYDDISKYNCKLYKYCIDMKQFLYNVASILGTADSDTKIYSITNRGALVYSSPNFGYAGGIRPVIEININDLEGKDDEPAPSPTPTPSNDTTKVSTTTNNVVSTTKKANGKRAVVKTTTTTTVTTTTTQESIIKKLIPTTKKVAANKKTTKKICFVFKWWWIIPIIILLLIIGYIVYRRSKED